MQAAEHGLATDAATAVPIAVSHPIANLITGALRPATVLARHSAAVMLAVEPLAATGKTRVVSLLTREASGVPNGARTAFRISDAPFAQFTVDDPAFVGAGGIRLPGHTFRAVRMIRTAVPHITPTPEAVAAVAEAAARARRGVPDEPVDELRAAVDSGDAAHLRRAVRALVGLGGGSTPGGDDVLAGTMAGLLATRREVRAEQIAAAALPDVDSRTPLISADLLRLAAAGHVCTEADGVLLACGSRGDLARALDRLFAVGHTSGADLATGLAIGLGAAAARTPRAPRHTPRGTLTPFAGGR